jgi:hypothetical protein
MTDHATATAAIDSSVNFVVVTDPKMTQTIRKELGERTYFQSDESETAYDKAAKYLDEAASKTETFFGLPIVLGDQDTLVSASNILIATVGVREKAQDDQPARNGYKALVVMAQPTVAEVLADESEAAKAFVAKLIERELTDVQYSGIRSAMTLADLEVVLTGLPTTVSELVENSRTGSESSNSSFDIMWNDFRRGFIKAKFPQLDAILPKKAEVAKALRSKAYAEAHPACQVIESQGVFVKLGHALVAAGDKWKNDQGVLEPLDTTDLQTWLANRDSVVLDYKAPEVKEVDLSGLEF